MSIGSQVLKIAFQTLDYPPDQVVSSIGLYTKTLAEALAARGHDIHVVSRSQEEGITRLNGVTVHRVGPGRLVIPSKMNALVMAQLGVSSVTGEIRYRQRLAKKLRSLVQEHAIELIEAADSGAEALFYNPRAHPSVPFIVRMHGPTSVWELFDRNVPEVGRKLIRAFERPLLLKATHLSAPSDAGAELFRKEMALGERRIKTYPNPPSFDLSRECEPDAAEPNMVVFVGRLTEMKGVDILVRAVPEVLEKQPDTRFVLVGPDSPTGRGYPSTKAYLLSLLDPRHHQALEFTGFVPHSAISDYYRRATLCVLPSIFDNFPFTCLEAMSFGKAVVGSASGGMMDMLDHGRCGLLYTPPNASELAQHIVTLLENPSLRSSLGHAARTRMLEHYSLEVAVAETEAFYRQAVRERHSNRSGKPSARTLAE